MTGSMKSLGRLAAAAAVVATLGAPGAARAQVGAIGGAAGGAVAGEDAVSLAPVFGESGLVLQQGNWSAGAYYGRTTLSEDSELGGFEFSYNQLLLGGFIAPAERLTVGAGVFFNSWSAETPFGDGDESGLGDLLGMAKYQFARSADGRTTFAGTGSVQIPVGDDEKLLASSDPVVGVGAAVTHATESVALSGSLGFDFLLGDDSDSLLSFGAGVVFPASDAISLSGELLGTSYSADDEFGDSERTTVLQIAPGIRAKIGQRMFLDGGFVLPLDNEKAGYDYALLLGLTVTR